MLLPKFKGGLVLLLVVTALVPFDGARAATTGEIRGTVTSSGNPVAGAHVTLSGAVGRSQVTGLSGAYDFVDLPQGIYTVEAAKAGYEPAVRRDIVMVGGRIATVPIALVKKSAYGTIGVVRVNGASMSQKTQFESTYSGSVLSSADITELGPQISMQTILALAPSIQSFTFGASPYMRTHLSFRGFTGGQFGETLDGIPLNGLFNGGVTNAGSQRNATPFVAQVISSVNVYRGVNDAQHTSVDSLGGSVAYHLVDPATTPHGELTLNVGSGFDLLANTGITAFHGARFAIALGSNYYRGFQNDVPDANRYVYLNGIVPFGNKTFARFIFNDDKNVGYTPHNVPVSDFPGGSLETNGNSFQWPAVSTYSYNKADVSLGIIDLVRQWNDRVSTRLTLFRYATNYDRISYTDPNLSYLPNAPFAPTFATWMAIPVTTNAADYAYHRYRNGDQRLGFVFRGNWNTSSNNNILYGLQWEHGHLADAEFWGGTRNFTDVVGGNDAWNQPADRNSRIAYVEDVLQAGSHWRFNPGIRFDRIDTALYTPYVGFFYPTPYAVGNSYHFTEPSFGVRYAFDPNHVAYAGIGTSAKAPNISAYYFDALDPNTNQALPLVVQPEKSTDLDVGFRGQSGEATWAVDAYRDAFTNTFSTSPAGVAFWESLGYSPSQAQNLATLGITLTTNAGNAVYQGVEFEAQHIPLWESGERHVTGFFDVSENGATYTSSYVSAGGLRVAAGTTIPYVPSHLLSAGVSYRSPLWHARLAMRVIGPQNIFDFVTGAPSTTQLPSYTTLDGYVERRIAGNSRASTSLVVSAYNLLDTQALVYGYNSSAFSGYPNGLEVATPLAPPTIVVSLKQTF
mgnify:CR=1 FL=1